MRGMLQTVWRLVKSFFSEWANIIWPSKTSLSDTNWLCCSGPFSVPNLAGPAGSSGVGCGSCGVPPENARGLDTERLMSPAKRPPWL